MSKEEPKEEGFDAQFVEVARTDGHEHDWQHVGEAYGMKLERCSKCWMGRAASILPT